MIHVIPLKFEISLLYADPNIKPWTIFCQLLIKNYLQDKQTFSLAISLDILNNLDYSALIPYRSFHND